MLNALSADSMLAITEGKRASVTKKSEKILKH